MLTGLAELSAETTGQTGEAVPCERADEDAHENIAQVVFADKDAADGYEWRPDEHPDAICLEPEGHPSA